MKPPKRASLDPKETLDRLRESVAGIDVHPVAVHLARAAWVLAVQPAIQKAADYGITTNITAPIYLGDALQLRFHTEEMFAQHEVTIQVEDERNTALVFPVSLVEQAETFDALMGDVAEAIERGEDPYLALDDHHITGEAERQTLKATIQSLQTLHNEGRNHIWAYYTRNLVRPVALRRSKVDVVIGNPPWLNYNQTIGTLRTELERQSRNLYGIWAGGRYSTHQDVAGLFYARSVDLYLKDGGVIGMVMPHSALQTGQHSRWRAGEWKARVAGRGRNSVPGRTLSVDFSFKTAWDLAGPETQHLLPHSGVCGVCQADGRERRGETPGRRGGALAWQGGRARREACERRHNRYFPRPYISLRRPLPAGSDHSSAPLILCGGDREYRHCPGRADCDSEPAARLPGQGALAQS